VGDDDAIAPTEQADGVPTATRFPDYAVALEDEMLRTAQILEERFPNTRLLYLSSRIYGGYAVTPLNPEPYAYEGGLAVKWLIEKQLAGDPELNYDPARGPVKAPWLAWGPYLWADGIKPRSDGLTYLRDDRAEDGTRPSPAGSRKVARQLLDFFKTDSTGRVWFIGTDGLHDNNRQISGPRSERSDTASRSTPRRTSGTPSGRAPPPLRNPGACLCCWMIVFYTGLQS
jgi:hypothetical protein